MPGAYPRVRHLKGASLGLALALTAKAILEKLVTNKLAYYENS
jgi:hypothetical protein